MESKTVTVETNDIKDTKKKDSMANNKAKRQRRKAAKAKAKKVRRIPYINLYLIIAFCIYVVAAILVSYFKLELPIAAIGSVVILEAILAKLLHNCKFSVIVNGVLAIIQILAGIYFKNLTFMILMVIIYLFALFLLFLWRDRDKK